MGKAGGGERWAGGLGEWVRAGWMGVSPPRVNCWVERHQRRPCLRCGASRGASGSRVVATTGGSFDVADPSAIGDAMIFGELKGGLGRRKHEAGTVGRGVRGVWTSACGDRDIGVALVGRNVNIWTIF